MAMFNGRQEVSPVLIKGMGGISGRVVVTDNRFNSAKVFSARTWRRISNLTVRMGRPFSDVSRMIQTVKFSNPKVEPRIISKATFITESSRLAFKEGDNLSVVSHGKVVDIEKGKVLYVLQETGIITAYAEQKITLHGPAIFSATNGQRPSFLDRFGADGATCLFFILMCAIAVVVPFFVFGSEGWPLAAGIAALGALIFLVRLGFSCFSAENRMIESPTVSMLARVGLKPEDVFPEGYIPEVIRRSTAHYD